MQRALRRLAGRPVTLALVMLLVVACGGATPSDVPAHSASAPTTTGSPAPTSSSPAGTTSPAPTTTSPAATTSPVVTASPAATACAVEPTSGLLPSDRMVDVVISGTSTTDLVTFVFGDASVPAPPQGAEGFLEVAEPPFTGASSGLPVEVDGEHVVQVRFTGMSLANDVGQPTYDGQLDFRPDLAALRSVVNFDMSEGVIGWYVGYDGSGCVTLTSDSRSVTVAIERPAS